MDEQRNRALKHLDEEIARVASLGPNQKPKVACVDFPHKTWSFEEIRMEVMAGSAFGAEQEKIWSLTHEEIERERNRIKVRMSKARL